MGQARYFSLARVSKDLLFSSILMLRVVLLEPVSSTLYQRSKELTKKVRCSRKERTSLTLLLDKGIDRGMLKECYLMPVMTVVSPERN